MTSRLGRRFNIGAIALASAALVGALVAAPAHAAVTISGSGSTFVKNLLDVCIPDYQKATGNTVNYAGGGSGAGRAALTAGTVDFAFSDAAYGSTEAKPADFVYAPIVAGPVAVFVKLDGFNDELNLSPKTISGIYSGKITKWNDPSIVADNNKSAKVVTYGKRNKIDPKTKKVMKDKKGKVITETYVTGSKTVVVEAKMPSTAITVWFRSDKSGTTGVFTNWLTKLDSATWTKAGSAGQQTFTSAFPGDSVPAGTFQGGSGSDGVANGVASKDGSIGYAEPSYASERKLIVAKIMNNAGEYIAPSPDATAVFLNNYLPGAKGTVSVDVLSKVSGAYTLGTFAYALGYGGGKDATKQAAVKDFFTYVLTTCATAHAVEKGYIPVVGNLAELGKANIAAIG
ncbi:MAG: phosphate ABC transporter substrate-binding protein, PhoT family [Actinobacteria bacterium]|uniref:Unannotated protein n=1 Tax=freshwater metagenome TaxID=449393 RepID=A0A6J7VI52_9ZZZZ|nr:phosphate ABC transporter substrate-binding protein, PhoT family [Actinomycetota bacterium]MTA50904.1 phosphate ABC transporter substrate-binding protein, PhoT family [Actinomycetota bacterium]